MRKLAVLTAWLVLLTSLALCGWSWWSDGIIHDLLRTDIPSSHRLASLKQFFDGFGFFAPLVYLVFVTVEVVVAPIPGLMLYAPGGIIFGAFTGGSLALIGNVLGAGIACSLTRSLGSTWLSGFFETERLEKTQAAIERRGEWVVFLLRVNPLTSSDLVSYAAGFTRIPVWKVMAATACGMAPLCYAQAWLAEGLMTSFPWLLYPLVILCFIYFVVVVIVVRRIVGRSAESHPDPSPATSVTPSIPDSEFRPD